MALDGCPVADIREFVPEYRAKSEANARLIAAAPELYEAVSEHLHAYDTGAKCCLDNLRAALAKAGDAQ